MLNQQELRRYSRHILLTEIGREGQEKLKQARVLVIGAGGLGCPALQYLAAAGTGTIGIVDFDVVDDSNLQRQILYTPADIGKAKAEAAAGKLSAQNPFIQVKAYTEKLSAANALDIFRDYDIILDGSDNFSTRYLVSDACILLGKPLVFGSVFRFEGQLSVFSYKGSASYRCLYPEAPAPGESPSCSEIGVLGVLPGMIGTMQANEAIKIITGAGEVLAEKLLIFDALSMNFSILSYKRTAAADSVTSLSDYEEFCETDMVKEIEPAELKKRLENGEDIQIIDVREPYEYEICNIGGELIPLAMFRENAYKISRDKTVVFLCRTGKRSAIAIEYLQGIFEFSNLLNLKGGIHAWAVEVDPEMERY